VIRRGHEEVKRREGEEMQRREGGRRGDTHKILPSR
jgi:hypothetical protein